MNEWTEIRQKVMIDHVSVRQICRDYNVSHHTVKKMIALAEPPPFVRSGPRARPKLDRFVGVIDQILIDDRVAPPKQHHTAKRIFERLRDEHAYDGSESQVRAFVAERRERTREVFVPLVQPAGEAQFDFGEAQVDIGGQRVKAHLAVMSLPHSDAFIVSAYPAECTETFQQAHVSAFDYFGGVPTKIAYDNTTIAVKKVMLGPNRELTDGFLRLQSHYLFRHRFCRVARGNEKGHVEHNVGYHRRNFLVPVPSFANFGALNDYLTERCFSDLDRVVRGESDTNARRLEGDLAAMRALPSDPFETRRIEHVTSNSLSLVRFDRNDYSVPTRYAHAGLVVTASVDTVSISAQGQLVASHARCWAREQTFYDPLHYLALLEKKPGAFDFAKPLAHWSLPECFNLLRRRLDAEMAHGATKAFIKVLRLLETYSLSELAAAVTAATNMGTTSYEAISLIVAHRAEEPTRLFSLDGRAHLAGVGVALPDLSRYRELTEQRMKQLETKSVVLLKHHLKALRLPTITAECEKVAASAASDNVDHLSFLLQLSELELLERERKAAERRMKAAKFPTTKTLGTFDFTSRASVNKMLVLELARGSFIDAKENVLFVGNPGTGKSHLATAIASAACAKGYKVKFFRVTELVTMLIEAKDQRTLQRLKASLSKLDLLVLDELGYVPATKVGAELLFDVIATAYERTSIMVTTNLPFESWTEVLGSERLTGATLDRLTHRCKIIETKGESYRLQDAKSRAKTNKS